MEEKAKIENIEELRSWLIDRIAAEDRLGDEYREFDYGLMSTVHYQRSAAFQAVLTKLNQATNYTKVRNDNG